MISSCRRQFYPLQLYLQLFQFLSTCLCSYILLIRQCSSFIIFYFEIFTSMTQIRSLYNVAHNITQNSQLNSYYPPRIYTDVNELKNERQKKQVKYIRDRPKKKLDLKCKKHTFIQQLEERQKKLPSPQTYFPCDYSPKYKGKNLNPSQRITIFQEFDRRSKNNPSPSPFNYDPIKIKSKSSVSAFQKAENVDYVEAVIYTSTLTPGVGQYNVRRQNSFNKLGKFDKAKRSESQKQNKLPSAATYQPKLMDKKLFSEMKFTKHCRPIFAKQKRFEQKEKEKNQNKNLYYAGISEWGMTKQKKKDLLSVLSKHNIYSKSVYYH